MLSGRHLPFLFISLKIKRQAQCHIASFRPGPHKGHMIAPGPVVKIAKRRICTRQRHYHCCRNYSSGSEKYSYSPSISHTASSPRRTVADTLFKSGLTEQGITQEHSSSKSGNLPTIAASPPGRKYQCPIRAIHHFYFKWYAGIFRNLVCQCPIRAIHHFYPASLKTAYFRHL